MHSGRKSRRPTPPTTIGDDAFWLIGTYFGDNPIYCFSCGGRCWKIDGFYLQARKLTRQRKSRSQQGSFFRLQLFLADYVMQIVANYHERQGFGEFQLLKILSDHAQASMEMFT